MERSNIRWVILEVSEITEEMICSSTQSGMGSLKKTLDGSKAILKWEGDTPSCFDGLTTYTHSEILTELAKSDWSNDE
jgi:hypothetical protein